MTAPDVFDALALPAEVTIDRRIPKSLLLDSAAYGSRDKRLIRERIGELRWLAALKPAAVGIAAHRDEEREYVEIAVLQLVLRAPAGTDRLVALVNRAIPYPVIMIVQHGMAASVSLAHKRRSLGDSEATVIDGEVATACLEAQDLAAVEVRKSFLASLPLSSQPPNSLLTVYQGWVDRVQAFRAAQITGAYSLLTTRGEAVGREKALRDYRALESEIARVSAAARKERQISRRAELNLELASLRDKRQMAHANL